MPSAAGARFIGQRLPRKEDLRLLTGRGSFVDDVVLPGMLHAAFVRSTIARGKIKSIDAAEARATPGVWAIYTADDLAVLDIQMVGVFMIVPPPGPKVYPLARSHVAHVGDPIVLVVAESRYIAEDAAARVRIDYEMEAPIVTLDEAMVGEPVHPGTDSNIAAAMSSPADPEIEKIFASAPHVVTGTIRHQRIAHCSMETRGVVVSKQGDELTVHMSCQGPQAVARILTHAFNPPPTRIRVISKDVGGAFGLKCQPWREEMAVIAAGLLIRRPVKWIEDRLENLISANQSREQECAVRIALDQDGRLLAAHADYKLNNGAFPHVPDANALAMLFLWAIYKVPHTSFVTKGFYSNTVGLAFYRGPWSIESLARETMLDVAARQIGIDPIELRRRNLVTAADLPRATSMGVMLEDVTPSECLDAVLKKLDVQAFRAEQSAARAEGRYLGLGVATYVEPTAASGGLAALATDVAQLRIEPSGKVTAILSTHSQGQGTQTTMAQVIADRLGVPFEDVSVFEDDSSAGGFGPGAVGSRQAVAGGGASIKAAEILLDKLKRVAAHLLNASPEDVQIADGKVRVRGAEEMTRSVAQIAEIAYGEPARLPAGMEPGLEARYRYQPPPMTLTSAAHACIVEVDSDTGIVHIKRWICSEDCGVVINPAVVEGQIAGGLAQAIGSVLMEDMHFDETGNPTAVTFKDYLLPTIADVPDFEYTHIATPARGEGGFRGVGEGGNIIGPPTLVNAIADALAPFGARCLELPLTPSKILKLMEKH